MRQSSEWARTELKRRRARLNAQNPDSASALLRGHLPPDLGLQLASQNLLLLPPLIVLLYRHRLLENFSHLLLG
ncbi:hypothetical protein [Klebsiella michiganensis]|uniref:hypothetical protein n=1 Tax=Klebsiella michiganensis TaxID=1134687 RepID=UPI000AC10E53|nr:hypothetical protein [Klebsiella michiganensis]